MPVPTYLYSLNIPQQVHLHRTLAVISRHFYALELFVVDLHAVVQIKLDGLRADVRVNLVVGSTLCLLIFGSAS